ncbi:hypothetical protein HaLaN_13163, partial [Haematococcus lacustris]
MGKGCSCLHGLWVGLGGCGYHARPLLLLCIRRPGAHLQQPWSGQPLPSAPFWPCCWSPAAQPMPSSPKMDVT